MIDSHQQEPTTVDARKHPVERLVAVLAGIFGFIYVISAVWFIPYQVLVGAYVGMTSVLILIIYPAAKGATKNIVSVPDLILIVMAITSALYFIIEYDDMQARAGLVTTADLVVGLMAILVSLETCRRVLGWILPGVGLAFIFYNLAGPYLPLDLAHPGFSLSRIVGRSFHAAGIFGDIASTYARYVFIFLILGGIFQHTGVLQAVINLTIRITGRMTGGPAKAAVISSATVGSVMGASVANIALTGPFTIPLMKKNGYPPETAGAIEIVASTGGQMLPPVMGAGAFILASFCGVSYNEVVMVSIAPALLYFVSLFATVHYESLRLKIGKGEKSDQLPLAEVLNQSLLLLPVAVLIISMMVFDVSAFLSAFISIMTAIFIQFCRSRSFTGTVRLAWSGLVAGSVDSLTVGCTAGVVGIIISMVDLPGLPITFTATMLSAVKDSLALTLLITAFVSLILGMGVTVTASYILVAIIAAPAMAQLGVPLLTAHLIIFWLSQDSMITPPFCLGGFVAGGIAGADPFRTALRAFRFAKPLYIICILMAYTPLVSGSRSEILYSFITDCFGMTYLSAAIVGYYAMPCSVPWRIALGLSGIFLFLEDVTYNIAGLVLGILIWFVQYLAKKRKPAAG